MAGARKRGADASSKAAEPRKEARGGLTRSALGSAFVPDNASQRSASPGRQSAARSSQQLPLPDRAQEYICDTLSVARVLAGLPKLKAVVYNCTRLWQQLDSQAHTQTEAVSLKAHLHTVELAQRISVESLPSLAAKECDEVLAKICPNLRPAEIPLAWKSILLAVYVRDTEWASVDQWRHA